MASREDDEMNILVATFLDEAESFVEALESGLMSLEDNKDDKKLIDSVFRAAHSLKGSSMAVGLSDISTFTHEMEALLLKIKEGVLTANAETISKLLECNDHVRVMISGLKLDRSQRFDSADLIKDLQKLNPASKKVEVSSGFGFFDDEEPAAAEKKTEGEANAGHLAEQTQANSSSNTKAKIAVEPIKVPMEKIDSLVNGIGEMAILMTFIQEHMGTNVDTRIATTLKQLRKISKDVQDTAVSLRMVPTKPLFQKLKRIVRDVSTQLGKKVEINFNGEDIEIDKTVLDLISDPLVHIVRNSVDHGVEDSESRLKAGKNEQGTVTLDVGRENNRLVFTIKDDGAGIKVDRIKAKALKLGIISPDKNISEDELINLIFHAGFSTKEQATEVSGRGVGMDVVKTNIEQMSGDIQVTSVPGEGSIFRISLPQTFSIIDSTIVMSGKNQFVIPLGDILESVRISSASVSRSTTLGDVITLRGEKFPLFYLNDLMGLKNTDPSSGKIAMLSRSQGETFAVVVDEIKGRHSLVMKNLGADLADYKQFSGSTILADGKPALIIELGQLVRKASHKRVDENLKRMAS
ncbi:MAG: chemotaxis protein CheA [Bdellovibrionota bacterium]